MEWHPPAPGSAPRNPSVAEGLDPDVAEDLACERELHELTSRHVPPDIPPDVVATLRSRLDRGTDP